jgi:hypothetical protein
MFNFYSAHFPNSKNGGLIQSRWSRMFKLEQKCLPKLGFAHDSRFEVQLAPNLSQVHFHLALYPLGYFLD